MRRTLAVVGVVILALTGTAVGVTAASAPGAGQPRYLDSRASIKDRVDDLLRRMTLAEKVGQMDQIVVGELRDTTPPANGDCNNSGGEQRPPADPLSPAGADRVPHRLDPVGRYG